MSSLNQPLPDRAMESQSESSSGSSPRFWRSLEELDAIKLLATGDDDRSLQAREFLSRLPDPSEFPSRRQFLSWMSASLSLAGLAGCTAPPEQKIVPYVKQPESTIPGKPEYYATAMEQLGFATGLLVESHQGRPTKIEGNPSHPASLGATDIFAQAECLSLYDPDRSQAVTQGDTISNWDNFLTAVRGKLERQRSAGGAGLRILTGDVSSPTLIAQFEQLQAEYPLSRWHRWSPVSLENIAAGARLAFGQTVWPVYRLDQADTILSLDADLWGTEPGHVRHARDFALRRQRARSQAAAKPGSIRSGARPEVANRLYAVECTPTLTGAGADHRLPVRPALVEALLRVLAVRLKINIGGPRDSELRELPAEWLDALWKDLSGEQPGGTGLVVPGLWQPPVVHALAHMINGRLGSVGKGVSYIKWPGMTPGGRDSLAELVTAIHAGQVEMLVILGGNPVFDAPADLNFAQALDKTPWRMHLSMEQNETSRLCHWQIPQSHFLESWGDGRAVDGTLTLTQPLIAPLYNSKTAPEVLATLLGHPETTGHTLLREQWRESSEAASGPTDAERDDDADFEASWQSALHDGLVADSAAPALEVSLREDYADQIDRQTKQDSTTEQGGIDAVFRPDPTIFDGRYANNGWLQELPKPLTKLTWDNAALVSPAMAEERGLKNGDIVELTVENRMLSLPIWILPGQPRDVIAVHFGYGRSNVGRVGTGTGFNVYQLRSSDAFWTTGDVKIKQTDKRYPLAATQTHHRFGGRDIIQAGTLQSLKDQPLHPPFVAHAREHEPLADESLYPPHQYPGHRWGMSIDLSSCIGCNACTIACQAENNIPVVGKQQVSLGREMHWIRVDNYYEGSVANPQTFHQPVPCMHCEQAPCEVVCPVAATVHGSEGLNQMVYNRCVGTRYCSNNCPYKVRRFNFLQYSDYETPVLKLLNNPDVTVRSRGVMEKCTYCVQRISAAKIHAEVAGKPLVDGDIQTACQQVCPTQAIEFGDLNDSQSRVRAAHHEPISYALLAELNTRPQTRYLAAVRNPHPDLKET